MTIGGMTPLMLAVESGNRETVALCLNASCNPFARNALNESALDLAEKFSHEQRHEYPTMKDLISEAIQ